MVGDHEKPLLLQSLWKPKEGFVRRFEIQRRSLIEEKISGEKDTITAGKLGGLETSVFWALNVSLRVYLLKNIFQMKVIYLILEFLDNNVVCSFIFQPK